MSTVTNQMDDTIHAAGRINIAATNVRRKEKFPCCIVEKVLIWISKAQL